MPNTNRKSNYVNSNSKSTYTRQAMLLPDSTKCCSAAECVDTNMKGLRCSLLFPQQAWIMMNNPVLNLSCPETSKLLFYQGRPSKQLLTSYRGGLDGCNSRYLILLANERITNENVLINF